MIPKQKSVQWSKTKKSATEYVLRNVGRTCAVCTHGMWMHVPNMLYYIVWLENISTIAPANKSQSLSSYHRIHSSIQKWTFFCSFVTFLFFVSITSIRSANKVIAMRLSKKWNKKYCTRLNHQMYARTINHSSSGGGGGGGGHADTVINLCFFCCCWEMKHKKINNFVVKIDKFERACMNENRQWSKSEQS